MKLKGELKLHPRETAVVVIDLQNGCCSPEGLLAKVTKQDTSLIDAMVQILPDFLDKMRNRGVAVIWVRTDQSREGMLNNVLEAETLVFGEFFDTCKKGTWGHDYFGPRPEKQEKEFIKRHPSVFQNQEFEDYLNERGITTLLFAGVFTSRCVFCSLAGASERGYRSILVKDMTANWVEKEYETNAVESIIHGMLGFVLDSLDIIELMQWK
ncbi:MAG: cysteine hydrolase family protein [Candidatus Heimdallarchaeota archaeon]